MTVEEEVTYALEDIVLLLFLFSMCNEFSGERRIGNGKKGGKELSSIILDHLLALGSASSD